MNQEKDYREFFALLNGEKVKYLIVGAYAMGFHGVPRFTGDIDILVEPSAKNAGSLMKVLDKFGFENTGIEISDFMKPDFILQLGYPPVRIDLLTGIDGVSFAGAWKNRLEGKYGKQTVRYLSKSDLMKNKSASGRQKDILDLDALRAMKRS